jgi:hypothetical protein
MELDEKVLKNRMIENLPTPGTSQQAGKSHPSLIGAD